MSCLPWARAHHIKLHISQFTRYDCYMVRGERLADKIHAVNQDHPITQTDLLSLQSQCCGWDRYPDLTNIVHPKRLSSYCLEESHLIIGRSAVVHPDVIVIDQRIPSLCHIPYLRPDGNLLECGGIRHQRSACPPYAPTPEVTQRKLSRARAAVVVQAEGLTSYDDQKRLHRFLLSIEDDLKAADIEIVGSWTAGPCRICEPEQECLGNGKCHQPKLRRFSMESCGIAVFSTCDRIANLSNDQNWRMELIEDWGLPTQSREDFKSVVLMAVT